MMQEMMGFWDGSGISWTICKQSAPCCRQITTPAPRHSIFTDRMLFLMPNQQCESIEGKNNLKHNKYIYLHIYPLTSEQANLWTIKDKPTLVQQINLKACGLILTQFMGWNAVLNNKPPG